MGEAGSNEFCEVESAGNDQNYSIEFENFTEPNS